METILSLINEKFVSADVVIKGEFIQRIDEYGKNEVAVDLGDKKIVAGIVDLHSDAIAKKEETSNESLDSNEDTTDNK